MVHQDRKRVTVKLPGGHRLALETNRRTKRCRDGSGQTAALDFAAKVAVEVSGQQSRLIISVNQAQFAVAAGSFLSIPKLLVYAVVSSDLPIFRLAKAGKVQDIFQLVADGQASLHDRDEHGWSLLHVSTVAFTLSPRMQERLTYGHVQLVCGWQWLLGAMQAHD